MSTFAQTAQQIRNILESDIVDDVQAGAFEDQGVEDQGVRVLEKSFSQLVNIS